MVEPYIGIGHGAVEVDDTAPDVGLARVGHVHLGQVECTVTLLDETGVAADSSTSDVAGVVVVSNLGVGCR